MLCALQCLDMMGMVEYWPVEQLEHNVADEPEYLPAKQSEHAAAKDLKNFPGVQWRHASDAGIP